MRLIPQGASSLLPSVSQKEGRGELDGNVRNQLRSESRSPMALYVDARDRPSPTLPPDPSRESADWGGGRREHEDEMTETCVV